MSKSIKKTEAKESAEVAQKDSWGELLSTVLWAVGIMLVLRTFVFQPFHIPSGSMAPGLMKGDYIITSKLSVGYGKYAFGFVPLPIKKGRLLEKELKRGDVIVFRPEGDNKNFIKRVVGLPGDQVQMKQGLLYINSERVAVTSDGVEPYKNQYGIEEVGDILIERIDNGTMHRVMDAQKNSRLDQTDLRTVPAGYYFMMGDNRDHSFDSRVSVANGGAGLVPKENIIERAEIVLLSANDDFRLVNPLTWWNMRGDRWFKGIE